MPEELVDVLVEPTDDEEENQEDQSMELNNFTDILYDYDDQKCLCLIEYVNGKKPMFYGIMY